MYWDIQKVIDYDALFNFIVGGRGVGKTYGAKQYVINDFLKNGNQFIYIRRYKTEFKKISKFFDDILDKYPDYEFTVNKGNFLIKHKCCEEWQIIGAYIALSTAKVEKSVAYPNVNTIIFDEFIIEQGYLRYLKDEVTNFLEAYSTIARLRDVKVYFLSNALTITNPYFIYFNISLPYGRQIKKKGDILVQLYNNKQFEEKASQTRFGNIIKDTQYGKYAINNNFYLDNENFVQKKTGFSRNLFCFKYKDEKYGVWYDSEVNLIFISSDCDKTNKLCYSMTLADHSPNTMLFKGKKSPLLKMFIDYYKNGCMRFESINLKNICQDIIKMTL